MLLKVNIRVYTENIDFMYVYVCLIIPQSSLHGSSLLCWEFLIKYLKYLVLLNQYCITLNQELCDLAVDFPKSKDYRGIEEKSNRCFSIQLTKLASFFFLQWKQIFVLFNVFLFACIIICVFAGRRPLTAQLNGFKLKMPEGQTYTCRYRM